MAFSMKVSNNSYSMKAEKVKGDDRAFLVKVTKDGKITREFEVLTMRTTDSTSYTTDSKLINK